MSKGYIAFVLHAHLPYVHHPESDNYIEERWLFEAISETYLPLLKCFNDLINENINYCVTMTMTPTLVYMLTNTLLQERYVLYLEKLIELTEKEIARTRNQPDFYRLAVTYNQKYKDDLEIFTHKYKYNIVSEFKKLQDRGNLEIIACPATHGYLPLMYLQPESVNAQITIGIDTYKKYFNCRPNGIWLPECGYIPELDKILKHHSIQYIITESHGILYASPKPIFGTYAPIVTPEGIVAFGRDVESSRQVWSSTDGYPGDNDYREFYRDIGYDLDYDYIKNYISPDGARMQTGIKYYRITGGDVKEPYNPEWARKKAELHASNFMYNRERQIEYYSDKTNSPPIVVCPYDAELFGHWWYEGPYWLYSLFKKIHTSQNVFKPITLSEYLSEYPIMQVSTPCSSSWGHKGYNEVWLNNSNDWLYRHLHKASERMVELANTYHSLEGGIRQEALNQAARELLLAQSSDWAFIMRTGTMVQYAYKRTTEHLDNFNRLYHDIKEDSIDEEWLRNIQQKNNIFNNIDFRAYKEVI